MFPAIILCGSPATPASAPKEAVPLSLDEAVARFRKEGFDLLIADASVAQAEGQLQADGALPPPALSASEGRTRGGYSPTQAGPGASDRAYSLGISDSNALSDLLWGKRSLRVRVAEAALAAARKGREDAARTLLPTLKQQYLQAALGQLNLDLSRQTRDAAGRTLELVSARRRAGAVSDAEVIRARVAALEAEQAVDAARQGLRTAEAGLAFLLGYRQAAPEFRLTTPFEHPAETPEAGPAGDPAREALDRRPDLQAAQAQIRRAEAGLSLARRNWAPDLTWSFGVSQEGNGQNALQPKTYTLGLGVPLPSFRRTRGEIAKAEADLRTQELQRARTEAQVRQDVAVATAVLASSRARLRRMDADLMPAAARAFELVSFQYEKGAGTLLDVLDAQRTLVTVKTEYFQDLSDYWTARFQMDQALGKE